MKKSKYAILAGSIVLTIFPAIWILSFAFGVRADWMDSFWHDWWPFGLLVFVLTGGVVVINWIKR